MPWPPPTHMVSRPNCLVVVCEAVEQRGRDPGAGHAERVPEGDRAAVDVELVDVDAELAVGRDHLRGERLVDLDEVDVVDRHAGARQRLRERLDRPEAHDLRGQPGHAGGRRSGRAASGRARRPCVSLMMTTAAAPSLSGQQLPAVTVPSGRNTGLQPATPSSVVPAAGRRPCDTTVPSGSVDRGDLALEEAVGDRLLGEVLRADAELVLLGAGDARELRDVLRRLAHRDVDVGQHAVVARVVPAARRRSAASSVRARASSKTGFVRARVAVAAPLCRIAATRTRRRRR